MHWQNLASSYRDIGAAPAWVRIGHSGVDLFFVISGFIMMVIARNYPANLATAGTFLYHRWARIYPAFWIWFLIALSFYLLRPNWIHLEPGQVKYLTQSFFLLPTWSPLLVPVSWTLKYELYFYLVFSIVILVPSKLRIVALLAWGGYIIVGQSKCYAAPEILCNRNLFLTMHPLALEFLFGVLVAWSYLRVRIAWPLTLTLFGCALLLAGFTVYLGTGLDIDSNLWYRVFLFGLPASVLLYGCVELERQRGCIAPDWLIKVGNASYSIYLSHLLLLEVLYATLTEYTALSAPSVDILALCAALGGGLLAYHVVELPLLRLSRGRYRLRLRAA